jgi:hypothetical protein
VKRSCQTITAAVLILISIGIFAESPKPSKSAGNSSWKQEPNSFIGIALDQPLTASVRQCPQGEPYTELCMSSRYEAHHPVEVCCVQVEPFEAKGYVSTSDETREGRVGVVRLYFKQVDFRKVADILTVRYGAPHSRRIDKVKTKGGAEFDSVQLFWTGRNVSVVVTSLAERFFSEIQREVMELGTVVVQTHNYARAAGEKAQNAARTGAGKL